MAFKKIGENLNFNPETDLLTPQQALAKEDVAERFVKMAKQLKKIAPKAEDFLYGHAIMMHASEAALVDQATGNPKLNTKGEPVKGWFEAVKLSNGKESVKWISPDGVKPYKNHNGDIFPEAELKKAHKMWIGRPLCKDHKSDSVEGVRGIIVDTYYDPKFKRVHALFALDKKNYADLARKVETGYANSVSMGTAVGRSVCTECQNIATVEKEYCNCIRARANYGEINLDLNPIELSLVVTPADTLAKIKHVIASMNNYVNTKQANIEKMKADCCVNPTELQSLADAFSDIQQKLSSLMKVASLEKLSEDDKGDTARLIQALQEQIEKATDPQEKAKLEAKKRAVLDGLPEDHSPEATRATTGGGEGYAMQAPEPEPTNISLDPSKRLASLEGDQNQGALVNEIGLLRSKLENMNKDINDLRLSISKEEKNMNSARLRARAKARRAYWLGGGGVNEPTPGKPKYEKEDADTIRNKEDKQMVGEPLETGSEGMHPGDEEVKKKLLRAEELQDRKLKREALVQEVSTEGKLTEAELEARRLQRRAYFQGGGGINEPTPGKPKYPKEDADTIRNTQDKQMVGEPLETGKDGLMGDDLKVKEHLLRAKLRAKLTKVADAKGNLVKGASKWDIFADDKLILSATATEAFEDEVDANWDFFSSKDYGKEVMKSIRSEGFERTAYLLKGAAEPTPEVAPMPAPAVPEAAAPAEQAPVAPTAEEKKDGGMMEKVNAALSTMEEKISEIRDLVSGSDNELVDVDMSANKAEQSPMDQVLASGEDLLKVEALLDDAADELALISETLEGLDKLEASVQTKLVKAAGEALSDGDKLVSEASLVIEAAKKKVKKTKKKKEDKKEEKEEKADKEDKEEKKDEKEAKAQELLDRALKVRAENRANLLKAAMEYEDMALTPQEEGQMKQLLKEEKSEVDATGKPMHPQLAEDEAMEVKEDDAADALPMMADEAETMCAHGPEDEHDANCMPAMDAEVGKTASRKAAREKLVAEASDVLGKYELDLGKAENATEPTYFRAHPGGKGTVTELTHTKTPEAKVETISEVHAIMRDVAESEPRNVREAAASLQEQIVKGAFTAADVEKLVAEGKVDSAAAAYWKKYFAQAPGAGSFGADLSKEFTSKKKEASDNTYKVKLRRAYDVGLQAQDKGLIATTREALDTYVDEIMHFDDAAFESNKRVIANYKSSKKSGSLPRVGLDAATQAMNVTAGKSEQEPDLTDLLDNLGWK
jgi:hypothetical protein